MIDKVINKNDNSSFRKYIYSKPEYAKHISIAKYLISKFSKGEWKNYPDDLWFIRTEFAICCTLSSENFSKDLKIHFIAVDLECSPLEIFNDPDLPDFT